MSWQEVVFLTSIFARRSASVASVDLTRSSLSFQVPDFIVVSFLSWDFYLGYWTLLVIKKSCCASCLYTDFIESWGCHSALAQADTST